RNPARMAPGIEMPAVTLAAPGVLDGRLDRQVDALWHGLNAEHFELPSSDAVQLLSLGSNDRPGVVRDPFQHSADDFTSRPLSIGLANRHNLLFDLDAFALRKVWLGDHAEQKTRGKTWYWRTSGVTVLDASAAEPLLKLRRGGALLAPTPA